MSSVCYLIASMAMIALAPAVTAHQLDEYLQAIRVDVLANRVDLEIDLTPGVKVAEAVLSLIDTDHDGAISEAEGESYARLFLRTVVLRVDDQSREVRLTGAHYPTVETMKSGTGTIQLSASAEFAPVIDGAHQLYLQNQHQPAISVYLVNAYAPKSPAIQIVRQTRDKRQREIRIEYNVIAGSLPRRTSVGFTLP